MDEKLGARVGTGFDTGGAYLGAGKYDGNGDREYSAEAVETGMAAEKGGKPGGIPVEADGNQGRATEKYFGKTQ